MILKLAIRYSILSLSFYIFSLSTLSANSIDEKLVRMSLNIFPHIVAVDLDLDKKLTNNGKIQLMVFYQRKEKLATLVAATLSDRFKSISGNPIEVIISKSLGKKNPCAILIVEKLPNSILKNLINYSIEKKLLIFSPFEKDVSRGVTVSMSIQIRIVPYFNRTSLLSSNIRIHRVLLKNSKFY